MFGDDAAANDALFESDDDATRAIFARLDAKVGGCGGSRAARVEPRNRRSPTAVNSKPLS